MLEDVEDLKPKMKSLSSISKLHLPATLTAKADGEFNAVFFHGAECYSINRNNRIRYELYALKEIKDALTGEGVEEALLLAELYGVVDGRPQRLPYFNSHKNDPSLHLGVFDLLIPDGSQTYEWKMREVEGWLEGCTYAHVLPYATARTEKEAQALWKKWVKEGGYEGIVARRDGETYKVKPLRDVDCAIIGVNKRKKLKQGEVTSLKVAVRDDRGRYIDLCDVASGIDHQLRKELIRLLDFKVGEDGETIYVQPAWVVEVQYQETYEAEKQVRGWDMRKDEGYTDEGRIAYYTLRHPRLVRFRADKGGSPQDIHKNQIG